MVETVLVELTGMKWGGRVYEVIVNFPSRQPPEEIDISEDGEMVLDTTGNVIGWRYYGPEESLQAFTTP